MVENGEQTKPQFCLLLHERDRQVCRCLSYITEVSGLCRLLAREAEEGPGLVSVKLLPIWLTSTVFALVLSQVSTLFTKQGGTMDRRVGTGGFAVPPAALLSFISFSFVILVPIYDRAVVPLARHLTGHPAGVTALQRVGSGIAASCLAMAVAATVEARRLRVARDAGLVDQPDATVPMSLWWIMPQYLLVGLARVLGVIGLEEFFYDQMPSALRSVGLALSLSAMGVGSFASAAVVSAIDWATRGGGESWFTDNLNRAHLDYFYWLLAGLAALDVAVFFYLATDTSTGTNASCDCDSIHCTTATTNYLLPCRIYTALIFNFETLNQ